MAAKARQRRSDCTPARPRALEGAAGRLGSPEGYRGAAKERRRRSCCSSARSRALGTGGAPKAIRLHFPRLRAVEGTAGRFEWPDGHRIAPKECRGARIATPRVCVPLRAPPGAAGSPKATSWHRKRAESARIALPPLCVLLVTAGRLGQPEGYRRAPKERRRCSECLRALGGSTGRRG